MSEMEDLSLKALLADAKARGRREALEDAAKAIEPTGPRPCDCENCDCFNYRKAQEVETWDTSTHNASTIRALAAREPETVSASDSNMIRAAYEEGWRTGHDEVVATNEYDDWESSEVRAMLAAAPEPPAAREAKGVGGAIDGSWRLPCDVRLPPATVIKKGCPLSTLVVALRQREKWWGEAAHG